MEYLGYILSPEGLHMSKDKVEAILYCRFCRKLRIFNPSLAFSNFYRCFIHEYSDIVIPLTHLTCKGTPWIFNDKCMAAFNELKQAFTHAPILTHWVPDWQLVVETDASDYALLLSSLSTLKMAKSTPLHSFPEPSQCRTQL